MADELITALADPTAAGAVNISPSSIESIDRAMHNWLENQMDVFCTTNKGWKKIPVIWVSAERAYQVKKDKGLRDSSGALILPIISLNRTAVVKDAARKGPYWANISPQGDERGGSITVARRIHQDKTSKFANADAQRRYGKINFKTRKKDKIVYQYVTLPQPVYIDVTYEISIWTEYQQQMNELVHPFITKGGGINYFVMDHEDHRYEGFIQQDFSQEDSVEDMTEEERKYQTKIEIKVLGKLLGDGPNQEQPQVVVRENAVEFKFTRERAVLDDEPGEWDKAKFRG
jgi:hypothetical protein